MEDVQASKMDSLRCGDSPREAGKIDELGSGSVEESEDEKYSVEPLATLRNSPQLFSHDLQLKMFYSDYIKRKKKHLNNIHRICRKRKSSTDDHALELATNSPAKILKTEKEIENKDIYAFQDEECTESFGNEAPADASFLRMRVPKISQRSLPSPAPVMPVESSSMLSTNTVHPPMSNSGTTGTSIIDPGEPSSDLSRLSSSKSIFNLSLKKELEYADVHNKMVSDMPSLPSENELTFSDDSVHNENASNRPSPPSINKRDYALACLQNEIASDGQLPRIANKLEYANNSLRNEIAFDRPSLPSANKGQGVHKKQEKFIIFSYKGEESAAGPKCPIKANFFKSGMRSSVNSKRYPVTISVRSPGASLNRVSKALPATLPFHAASTVQKKNKYVRAIVTNRVAQSIPEKESATPNNLQGPISTASRILPGASSNDVPRSPDVASLGATSGRKVPPSVCGTFSGRDMEIQLPITSPNIRFIRRPRPILTASGILRGLSSREASADVTTPSAPYANSRLSVPPSDCGSISGKGKKIQKSKTSPNNLQGPTPVSTASEMLTEGTSPDVSSPPGLTNLSTPPTASGLPLFPLLSGVDKIAASVPGRGKNIHNTIKSDAVAAKYARAISSQNTLKRDKGLSVPPSDSGSISRKGKKNQKSKTSPSNLQGPTPVSTASEILTEGTSPDVSSSPGLANLITPPTASGLPLPPLISGVDKIAASVSGRGKKIHNTITSDAVAAKYARAIIAQNALKRAKKNPKSRIVLVVQPKKVRPTSVEIDKCLESYKLKSASPQVVAKSADELWNSFAESERSELIGTKSYEVIGNESSKVIGSESSEVIESEGSKATVSADICSVGTETIQKGSNKVEAESVLNKAGSDVINGSTAYSKNKVGEAGHSDSLFELTADSIDIVENIKVEIDAASPKEPLLVPTDGMHSPENLNGSVGKDIADDVTQNVSSPGSGTFSGSDEVDCEVVVDKTHIIKNIKQENASETTVEPSGEEFQNSGQAVSISSNIDAIENIKHENELETAVELPEEELQNSSQTESIAEISSNDVNNIDIKEENEMEIDDEEFKVFDQPSSNSGISTNTVNIIEAAEHQTELETAQRRMESAILALDNDHAYCVSATSESRRIDTPRIAVRNFSAIEQRTVAERSEKTVNRSNFVIIQHPLLEFPPESSEHVIQMDFTDQSNGNPGSINLSLPSVQSARQLPTQPSTSQLPMPTPPSTSQLSRPTPPSTSQCPSLASSAPESRMYRTMKARPKPKTLKALEAAATGELKDFLKREQQRGEKLHSLMKRFLGKQHEKTVRIVDSLDKISKLLRPEH